MYKFSGSHVGFVFDGDNATPYIAAALKVDFDSIILEIPLLDDVTEPYDLWFADRPLPDQLLFRNVDHCFSLSGLGVRRHQRNLGVGHGVGIIEADRIVKTGINGADYTTINGLQSEIVGLPRWIAPDVFSFEHHVDAESRITGVDFHLSSVPSIEVPGTDGLSLTPTFAFDHDWANGKHEMRDFIVVQTEFASLTDWNTHHRLHRTLQDLISIAFWHPCNLDAKKVLHADDPERTLDGASHGTVWRQASVSGFGRRAQGQRIRDIPKSKERPLFTFADIGVEGVAKWYAEYDAIGQAMWVLSASLFREGGTVEVRLFQVAMALEALGYHLATSNRQREANFEPTIVRVAEQTDCKLDKVFKDHKSAAEWAQAFNRAYLGVKHADNPLPAGLDAYERAEEGALLARMWLARHLGVSRETLEARIQHYT